MTDPTAPQPHPSPHLPINWPGGSFEGHLPPLVEDWFDEAHTAAERAQEMRDWGPFDGLPEGDPPGQWGFDPGGSSAASAPTLELLSGVVSRVAGDLGGLQLEELPSTWLNVSRYAEGLTLRGVAIGDVLVLQIERTGQGRIYIRRLVLHQTLEG